MAMRLVRIALEALGPRAQEMVRGWDDLVEGAALAIVAGAVALVGVAGLTVAIALWLVDFMHPAGATAMASLIPMTIGVLLGLRARRLFSGPPQRSGEAASDGSTPPHSASPQATSTGADSPTERLVELAARHPALSVSAAFAALSVLGPWRLVRTMSKAATAASLVSMVQRAFEHPPPPRQGPTPAPTGP